MKTSKITNIVKISDSISDWQIFQQINGFADITVSGEIDLGGAPISDNVVVYVRIIRENSMLPAVNWTAAKRSGTAYSAIIEKIPAGGNYTIEVTASEDRLSLEWGMRGECRKHIGVGDIYVIAGQSNSAGYGKTPASDIPDVRVHLYRNCGEWDLATHPMNESTHSIHPVNAEGGNSGHSPYLSFAKSVLAGVNYPIGLVQCSLGGSPISSWNPHGTDNLYTNMVECINDIGGKITGILWYQGCSDCDPANALNYLAAFTEMVDCLRGQLGYTVPFLTVQLGKCLCGLPDSYNDGLYYGIVRNAQRLAAKTLDKVYVVPAVDLHMSDGIHNSTSANLLLGERIACEALGNIYSLPYPCGAPDIAEITYREDRVYLRFSGVHGYLHTLDADSSCTNFHFEDDSGEISFGDMRRDSADTLSFKLNRTITGKPRASLGALRDIRNASPFDRETGLPALCFMEV